MDCKQLIACSLKYLRLAYNSFGNYEKAIKYYGVTIFKKTLYALTTIASSLKNLRLTYNSFGNYKKAIKYYKALNMKKFI